MIFMMVVRGQAVKLRLRSFLNSYHYLPSMDLDPIGAHCSLSSCNELDFLPIQCRCTKYFCRHHITPESHSCPVDPAALNLSRAPFEKLQRCAVEKCGKPTLESFIAIPSDDQGRSPAVCVCQKSFCAE